MKDEIKICKKCQKSYQNHAAESDLCSACNKKYPYFISFIEEGFVGVNDINFGRVEVYRNDNPSLYDVDEIRFLYKNNTDKEKEFRDFRDKWDFNNITKKELELVKRIIKVEFSDIE